MKVVSGCLLGLSMVMISSAYAAVVCTSETNVVKSTLNETENAAALGHVSQHVDGYPAVVDKTRFEKWADFLTVFNAWAALVEKNPKIRDKIAAKCGAKESGDRSDCVDLADLNTTINAYKCKTLDTKGGCDKKNYFTPKSVEFHYLNNSSTNGKWAVKSAYPSASACKKK